MYDTLIGYLDHWATDYPDEIWLRDVSGDDITDWTWKQVRNKFMPR